MILALTECSKPNFQYFSTVSLSFYTALQTQDFFNRRLFLIIHNLQNWKLFVQQITFHKTADNASVYSTARNWAKVSQVKINKNISSGEPTCLHEVLFPHTREDDQRDTL